MTVLRIVSFYALLFFSLNIAAEQRAPNFVVSDIQTGSSKSLNDFAGKVIYLDFWASWCGPCRKSFPEMEKIYLEKKAQGFEVVTINLDESPDLGKAFLAEFSVSFTNLYDANKKTPIAYEVQTMPSSFLIDRKGNIRLKHRGFKDSDVAKISKAIDMLLNER